MNKTKMFVFALSFILVAGIATAGLVDYLSNTVEYSDYAKSPFTIDEEIGLELEIGYSGNDDFALVKITNHAERDITADVKLEVTGSNFGYDTEGIAIAISEDINYCFAGEGDMTGVIDCETNYMTWMENNINWNDWYANEAYDENIFFSDLVINYEENSFHGIGYNGNIFTLPGLSFPAEESVYGIVYVTTNPALEEADYNFGITVIPTVA